MHIGEEGGTLCTPSEDFKNFDHKNAIKHKYKRPPLDCFTTPCTLSKEFGNGCASM
jgi:hypothetical protein